jgi:hypothetical protein
VNRGKIGCSVRERGNPAIALSIVRIASRSLSSGGELAPPFGAAMTIRTAVQAALLVFSTFTPPPSSSMTLLRSFTSA